MNAIKIINIFKSIDGEAYHAGRPTIFVRTYGCNLRCAYPCDTPESWDENVFNRLYKRKLYEMTPEAAFSAMKRLDPDIKHATITGGEPLLPENIPWMQAFTEMLVQDGYDVDFETNGAVSLLEMADWRDRKFYSKQVRFIMDWKCPSSKMLKRMIPANLAVLGSQDVVKCVVSDIDFEEVDNVRALLDISVPIYISPCFGNVTMSKIPEFVVARPKGNFVCQLQIHKYCWPVEQRDV